MTRRSILRVLLAVLFLLAAGYQGRATRDSVAEMRGREDRVQRPFGLQPVSRRITKLRPEAQTAGLREGDLLLAVDGRPVAGHATLTAAIRSAAPGDILAVEADRSGGSGTFLIALAPRQDASTGVGARLRDGLLRIGVPWFCLLLGFWVAAVRPTDRSAWLLLALMLGYSRLTSEAPFHWAGWSRDLGIGWHIFWETGWGIWMMLFGLYFPERLPPDERWPWAKWLLLAPLGVFVIATTALQIGYAGHIEGVGPLRDAFAPWERTGRILQMVAVGFFFMGLGWKQGTASNLDVKRRLRLLLYGTQISLAPMFILVLRAVWLGTGIFTGVPAWAATPALLGLFLAPCVLAYVIVVHRALDVRVVIRQGIKYAFARGSVIVLRLLLIAGVVLSAVLLVTRPETRRVDTVTIVGAGIMLAFLIRRGGDSLMAWTDRRFFRDAYDAEQILSELGDRVRTMVETEPLLETVARRISESLHVPKVAILMAGETGYRPAHALGFPEIPDVTFPHDSASVTRMKSAQEPIRVYLDDPASWINRNPGHGPEEPRGLEALRTQLLLPLMARDDLPGFISLGPKLSEEPFSRGDLRLLQAVATQAGLALQNSRLTAVVATEIAKREMLHREVEIAREVQERLFPQSLPRVEGLDYFGCCRPALAVGGDYYDFLTLPDGSLGIAIGDVSGKGIGAALLMASLQASLRGQTFAHRGELADLVGRVNRLVHDASPMNRYATLFVARYEPAARRLTYVNGGHNAPMLLRRTESPDRPERLPASGTVVGLMPEATYREATVLLQPGDLLVAFTDGISEAQNGAEEEWGEARLTAVLGGCRDLQADRITSRILEEVDAFTAGAPQYDDMTLVVARAI